MVGGKAKKIMQEADAGDAHAALKLGRCALNGSRGAPKDLAIVEYYMKKAAHNSNRPQPEAFAYLSLVTKNEEYKRNASIQLTEAERAPIVAEVERALLPCEGESPSKAAALASTATATATATTDAASKEEDAPARTLASHTQKVFKESEWGTTSALAPEAEVQAKKPTLPNHSVVAESKTSSSPSEPHFPCYSPTPSTNITREINRLTALADKWSSQVFVPFSKSPPPKTKKLSCSPEYHADSAAAVMGGSAGNLLQFQTPCPYPSSRQVNTYLNVAP